MRRARRRFWLVPGLALLAVWGCAGHKMLSQRSVPLAAHVRLPAIFSDHMVLQRDTRVPVWGQADPGRRVIVEIGQQRKEAIADAAGRWRVDLDPLPAGGPWVLKIVGIDTLRIRDVLVGEVWLASGQSNMEMSVERVRNAEAEIQAANYPQIRLFTVKRAVSLRPLNDVASDGWHACNPQSVRRFSAVAYFFGRELYRKLGVPIGLVHSSWGGTPAEAWTSREGIETLPDFTTALARLDSLDKGVDLMKRFWQRRRAQRGAFLEWVASLAALDTGFTASPPWFTENLDVSRWDTMTLPVNWEDTQLGEFDGVVWFRKRVSLPASWAGQDLVLRLGPINDIDTTWFNGVKVGGVEGYDQLRVYRVPGRLVKPGQNGLVVRVLDYGNRGGLWGRPEQLRLVWPKRDSMSLAGVWRYRPGLSLADAPPRPKEPRWPTHRPTVLYNAMIAPLVPFAIRGVIWYQGEANASRAYQYRRLFPTMIQDWRQHWGQGDFPFLFVQLANFRARKPEPGESDWAELREAQTMALKLPNTGMAVIIDIGEANDIHPKNKQDVGRRLARIALAKVYGKKLVCSGPMYRGMKIEGSRIRLFFDHVDGGLVAKGGELRGFAVAGPDRVFRWAQAKIEGSTVVVWSPEVPHPVAVRYAWADNPDCNLYNRAGLPASPFRTDDWPGITFGKK